MAPESCFWRFAEAECLPEEAFIPVVR